MEAEQERQRAYRHHFGAPMADMVTALTHPAAATEIVSMADCNVDRVPACC
jgi:hypothetical protein